MKQRVYRRELLCSGSGYWIRRGCNGEGELYNNITKIDKNTPQNSYKIHRKRRDTNLKYLIKRNNNRYYYQFNYKDIIKQFTLKTDNLQIALFRRDLILNSLNNIISVEHDKITLSITLKIVGIKKMLENIPTEDLKKSELTEEQEYNKIKILQDIRNQKIKLEEEEIRKIELLKLQETENILNIQNDSKLKYENLELNLTEKQLIELQLKKEFQKEEIKKSVIIEEKEQIQNLPYKEYWEKYIEWKKDFQEKNNRTLSKDSLDKLNTAYNFLLDFLDKNENYNVYKLTPIFFDNLQTDYLKIPSRAKMLPIFKNKSLKEIIKMEFDIKKYPLLKSTNINNIFSYYRDFYNYLSKFHNYKENVFEHYKPLYKNEVISCDAFEQEEIKLLLNNNLKLNKNTKIEKELIQKAIKFYIYGGFRLNELVQIKKTDIIEVEGVLCWNLTKEHKLKNAQSIRIIPIHSKIIDLVKEQMKLSENEFLIFNGDEKEVGKAILRYIEKFKFEGKKVIHSFRSNFIQYLYSQNGEKRHIHKLSGHAPDKTDISNYYYNKNISTMEQLINTIELLKYDID